MTDIVIEEVRDLKFDELVSKNFNILNDSDKLILAYINENRKAVPYMGIEELAKECLVSRSTVMRFAQKLNLNGFSELKMIIKWELSVQKEASRNIVDTVCDTNINIINNFRKMDCDLICKDLFYARRIFVYGTGNIQRAASNEFKRILLSLGIIVENIAGEGELLKTMKLIDSKDIILLISQNGNSNIIKQACDYFNIKRVPVISLTFSGNNYLANHSDHKIFLQYEKIVLSDQSTIKSVTMMFSIIEILCAKFIEYLLKLEDELKDSNVRLDEKYT